AFTGEGGTSEGEFHEALNVAAVWKLPVIFVIENNGYGLSTPVGEQYACENLSDRAKGYGMAGEVIDGNNVIEVYRTVSSWAKKMRENPEPVLIECKTFRMRGHEEASGTKYVPVELMEYWAKRDPVVNYERELREQKILSEAEINVIRSEFKSLIENQLKTAREQKDIEVDVSKEIEDVYASHDNQQTFPPIEETSEKRLVDAVRDALDQALGLHYNLVIMGQDIAEYGGVFKATDGLHGKYGPERVRNTPLCESAIIGIALGLAIRGYKSVVEMQFADFVSCGFNQIVNNLAKVHYRWGQKADVVIRMPTGAGVAAGPFHSQSNEAWFCHVPGLKVVYPSNAFDAKGLLLASIEDPNPVLFFEHKYLYRTNTAEVALGYYNLPLGKARVVREGNDASIITYGMGVHWAKEEVEAKGLDVEILDLRTLQPLDHDAVKETVKKTNRVILLQEDTMFGGIASELAAYISEDLFEYLDAPVVRCASIDTPVPFNPSLEKAFLAKSRLSDKLEALLSY
ncbi:MAG: thiamine pyrophosphate-dependent enzyme, partial [Saprospiraceae bacterium]|nr:thiamine pyrophosphate-dependent enzyme [Saprospiraceae bacterium]